MRKIRLTESDFHKIIKETVKRILKESDFSYEKELAQKYAELGSGSLTDEENEILKKAGFTFDTISAPGYRVTDINLLGRRIGKTINGKTKWY